MNEVTDVAVNQLERRARLLLRAYPPGYRADRGEEIIGTLLEATPPGRSRPPAREAASVIMAGLGARRDANLRQGLAASLRQAAILGIAVFLAPGALVEAVAWWAANGFGPGYLSAATGGWEGVLSSVLVLVILAAVWHGRRWLVAVPPAVAATAAVAYYLVSRSLSAETLLARLALPVVLGLVVLVPLATRAHRPPKSLLWLLCLPLGAMFLAEFAVVAHLPIDRGLPVPPLSEALVFSPYTTYLSLITVAVAVCWLVTDVRPLAGLVLAFLLDRVADAFGYPASGPALPVQIAIAIPVALACALVWLLRRRTRTSPTAVTTRPHLLNPTDHR